MNRPEFDVARNIAIFGAASSVLEGIRRLLS
jgi:hypothetical protein